MFDVSWILHTLGVDVDKQTVKVMESFSEEEYNAIHALNTDGARMYISTLNTLVLYGWDVHHLWSFEFREVKCTIRIENSFHISLGNNEEYFTLNRYGQMQLHLWLLECVEHDCFSF